MTEKFQTSPDRQWLAVALIDALALLAAPFKDQMAALPPEVMTADEVALVFDDAFATLARDELPPAVRDRLEAIDRRLMQMTTAPARDEWSLHGLEHDSSWQELRVQASDVLGALGVAGRRPSGDWTPYVSTRSRSKPSSG